MKNVVGSIMSSLLVIAAIILAIMVFMPYVVNAQTPTTTTTDSSTKSSVCEGIGLAGGGNGCDDSSSGSSVGSLVKNIINVFSFIIGVVAVVMIMIGGFRYVTSGGDSNSLSAAKNTILYAIVGLVVVAFAQIIVRFVIHTSTKVQDQQSYNHSLSVNNPFA